jgi:acetyltransferase-like isoleucine patch superfamily enzyme
MSKKQPTSPNGIRALPGLVERDQEQANIPGLHLDGEFGFLCNFLCTILDNNEVRIGNHAMIGPGVQIYTAAHPLRADVRNEGWKVAKPIVIEDGV